jgi:hypothetical protein
LTPATAPEEPIVKPEWAVATPPTVILLAATVCAVMPCISTRREVGALPMKLNVVTPVEES